MTTTGNRQAATDAAYMRRALELALHGQYGASPNPMVGAVVVAGGRIIGEGFHALCGGPHAEVRAMASVQQADMPLVEGSTVYVTLEPCAHYGKTPPCAAMLAERRVGRVVVGCTDPFARVDGRGLAMLKQAGIEVEVGVLEKECRWLNRRFFTAHTLHRPYVILKWACSADGWLDSNRAATEPAPRFSTPVSTLAVMEMRACADAIAVGARTVLNDNPSLSVRGISGRNPRPVIFDRAGLTNGLGAQLITEAASRGTVVFGPGSGSLDEALGKLYAMGVTSLLVEGGAILLGSFLERSDLWDEARCERSRTALGSRGSVRAPQLPAGYTVGYEIGPNSITEVYSPVLTRRIAPVV